ncbi:beta-1,3-galactosyl-O-glycosyl-glycoprotein beta-1,6-N-acetylglucosaminyltransferase-like [Cololabis saira]|uniref:beta-1,3-galactosyl-O-glycosyl-glycoprotein beta-1,6-N-acetylglucosaminyltransferase-like n=1 Tax=Cololabis saira TaxID=129043 RepID=UPI002AD37156|nr:beta-1,3-galactosyl-O-glycosyl-glycoprotein beta-1,6-N-acetylglucosaminyltransferase-like [Cololabis saira]XP_061585999.1 beta-1,3-galactosyl-O-glycosyl-glycoprotein beta-1,6-N-acetylglucosaminyltransferase-like [Cololabis saira]
MRWHTRRPQKLLQLTAALGSLCILFLLIQLDEEDNHMYIFGYSELEYTADDGPEKGCNCTAIFKGDPGALDQAKLLTITRDFKNSIHLPDEYYINATQDCRSFKLSRKYIRFPLSKEEEEFPIAYSMVVHHKVQNFERLLRAIYAPQNIYCVHVDKKSQASVSTAIQAIVSCFPNVFLVSKAVSVTYAAWPCVQAELNCMADLYNSSTEWKYFINLCGQDFPLKTNFEMVKMLQGLRGGNSLESEALPSDKKWRINYVHQIVNGTIKNTGKVKDPPPFDLPIMSGSAYIVVSRGYIRSVLEDGKIQSLIEWFKDTYSPDENIWATIQRVPGVPGSRWPHRKHDMTDMNAFARLVKWDSHEGSQDSMNAVYPACQGHHMRNICVYGTGDLQWLIEQHHFFANKFDTDIDPIAVYCLEKYLRKKAIDAIT